MTTKGLVSLAIVFAMLMSCLGLVTQKLSPTNQPNQQLKTQLAATMKERDAYKAELAVKNNEKIVKASSTEKEKTPPSVGVQNIDLKQVNQLMTKFVNGMYANSDANLMHRYNKMKPMLSGKAFDQLKPKSNATNTDNGQNAATVTDIKNYVAPQSTSEIDVLSEYTLNSKVGDNEIKSPMILKVTVGVTNNHYSISDFKTNSAFASNLSDRK